MVFLISEIYYDIMYNAISGYSAYYENFVFDEVGGKIHLSFRGIYSSRFPHQFMSECLDIWEVFKGIPADLRLTVGGYDRDLRLVMWSKDKPDSFLLVDFTVRGILKRETLRLVNRDFKDSTVVVGKYEYYCDLKGLFVSFIGKTFKNPLIILFTPDSIMFYENDTLFMYVGDSVKVLQTFNGEILLSAVPFGVMGIYEYSSSNLYIYDLDRIDTIKIENKRPKEIHITKSLKEKGRGFNVVVLP